MTVLHLHCSGFRVWYLGQNISETLLLWGLQGLGSIKTGPKRCISEAATGSRRPRVVVVWCFGQHAAGKPWVLRSPWMIVWYDPRTPAPLQTLSVGAPLSRIIIIIKHKWFRNVSRCTKTSFSSKFPQISVQTSIFGMCRTNRSDPRRLLLVTHRSYRLGCKHLRVGYHSTASGVWGGPRLDGSGLF